MRVKDFEEVKIDEETEPWYRLPPYLCSYCGGALRRPLLEDGYEALQSADEPEGAERGVAFVRQLLFEVLFAEFVDISADVTNVRGLPASALQAHARFPSLQFARDARPAFLCLD